MIVAQSNSPDDLVVLFGVLDGLPEAEALADVVAVEVPDGLAEGEGLVNRVPLGEGTAIVGAPARSTGADSARTPNTTATSATTAPMISATRPQLRPRRRTPGSLTGSL